MVFQITRGFSRAKYEERDIRVTGDWCLADWVGSVEGVTLTGSLVHHSCPRGFTTTDVISLQLTVSFLL